MSVTAVLAQQGEGMEEHEVGFLRPRKVGVRGIQGPAFNRASDGGPPRELGRFGAASDLTGRVQVVIRPESVAIGSGPGSRISSTVTARPVS